MTGTVLGFLLALFVACIWLAAIGFLRLRRPLDRLHCVAFVNTTAGLCLVLGAFIADGVSDRAGKILLAVLASLVAGAATSHAIARALAHRGSIAELREP